MIAYALTTDDCTPETAAGIGAEIDRREQWQARYLAAVGRVQSQAAYCIGLRWHNGIQWRGEFGRVLRHVTAQAQRWLATRPTTNVVTIKRRRVA